MMVIDNKLGLRIKALADKSHKTFNEQLELMNETFEVMDIHKVFFLPGPAGHCSVPVIEVSEPVIQRG